MYSSPSAFGTTREVEYERSAEYFKELCEKDGVYFGLAMLIDSGYGRIEFIKVLDKLKTR